MNKINFKLFVFVLLVVMFMPSRLLANNCNFGNQNITVNANNNSQYGAIVTAGGSKNSTMGGLSYSSYETGGCVGSSLFCVTPSMHSQGSMSYTQSSNPESLRDCTNSLDASNPNCGLAAILDLAYSSQTAANGNWDQMDAAVTLALRLWSAKNTGGTSPYFNDDLYGNAATDAANTIWNKVQSGGNATADDISAYLKDQAGSETVKLAVEWYSQAVKGVDIKQATPDFQKDNLVSTVNQDGSTTLEMKAGSMANGLNNIQINGISNALNYESKTCSDGSGTCYVMTVTEEAKKQLCEGKPFGTKIPISVNVQSKSAVDNMYMYKPSTNGSNQYYVGFNAYDTNTTKDIEIECEDLIPNNCEKKDDRCYVDDQEVDCNDYPECKDVCVKKDDKCYVGTQEVNCADYPECEELCEIIDDKCYVGDQEVNCADYPECANICEVRFDGCYVGNTKVECSDYPGTDCDLVCEKVDDICYMGNEIVNCEDFPECDLECEVKPDGCYVGSHPVNCEDYPGTECDEECVVDPSGTCTKGGKPVDCDAYPECQLHVCEIVDGKYYGNSGTEVDRWTYRNECFCSKYNDPKTGQEVCRDNNGGEIACSEFPNYCNCDTSPIVVIGFPNKCFDDDGNEIGCDQLQDICGDPTPGNCPVTIDDELPYETCIDDQTEGKVADPAQCSILQNTIKQSYYRQEFSNSYCEVFCRETIEFKFMDKETAQAGRYFRHHLEGEKVQTQNLSTVVKSTQQCTSVIDYDKWKRDYEAANANVRNSWNELKMWEARWEVSAGQSGLPTQIIDCGGGCGCEDPGCLGDCHLDVCGDWMLLWYDAYYQHTNADGSTNVLNVNLTEKGMEAKCAGWVNPCGPYGWCPYCDMSHWDAKTAQQMGYSREDVIIGHGNAVQGYIRALNTRNELIDNLFNCNLFTPAEVSQYFNDPGTYTVSNYQTQTHQASPQVESKTYQQIIDSYYPDERADTVAYDDQSRLLEEGSAADISFDKEMSEPEASKGYLVSANSNKPEEFCAGCNDDITSRVSSSPRIAQGEPNKEFGFWVCYDHTAGANCVDEYNSRLRVPENYVTDMTVTIESGHWVKETFSTEIFTGKIISGGGGLQLPEKSWPLAVRTETGTYPINVMFTNLGDRNRKSGMLKLQFSDDVTCGYNVVNQLGNYNCDDSYPGHNCYNCDDPTTPEVELCVDPDPNNPNPPSNPNDLGVYFRTVDLNNLFPNSEYDRSVGGVIQRREVNSNWRDGGNGHRPNAYRTISDVVNEIQQLGNRIWVEETPEYSISLTPSMRKAIKRNNKNIQKGDYLNYSMQCMGSGQCTSTWLSRDLYNILQDYNHPEYYKKGQNATDNQYRVGGAA